MNWSWFVGVLLEWSGIMILFHSLEDRKEEWNALKFIVCFLVYIILTVVIYAGILPESFSVLGYIQLFVYLKWTYKETLEKSFAILVIGSVLVSLLEICGMWLLTYIIEAKPEAGIFDIASGLFTSFGCIFLSKLKLYKLMQFLEQREFMYVVIALLSLMLFMPVTVFKIIKNLDVLDYIYICICVVLMWMMASKMQDYKMDMKYRRKYLEGYSDVILQMRRRHHTVANQLNAVVGMCEVCHSYEELVERQREYLGKLQNYELPTEAIVLEEPAVVALIYEKLNQAVEKGIEVETSFHCSLVGRHVSDLEWVEILGVLLENAIEALDGYGGRRKLWISVRENEEQRVEVCIANTFRELRQEELEKFCQAGYSTKGDGRGIGLYDVKELVHKHRGELRLGSRKEMGEDMLEIWVIL